MSSLKIEKPGGKHRQTYTISLFIKKITNSPKLVIKSLKEAEYKPGVKYAIRSVLAYFNCILYLLVKLIVFSIFFKNSKNQALNYHKNMGKIQKYATAFSLSFLMQDQKILTQIMKEFIFHLIFII